MVPLSIGAYGQNLEHFRNLPGCLDLEMLRRFSEFFVPGGTQNPNIYATYADSTVTPRTVSFQNFLRVNIAKLQKVRPLKNY